MRSFRFEENLQERLEKLETLQKNYLLNLCARFVELNPDKTPSAHLEEIFKTIDSSQESGSSMLCGLLSLIGKQKPALVNPNNFENWFRYQLEIALEVIEHTFRYGRITEGDLTQVPNFLEDEKNLPDYLLYYKGKKGDKIPVILHWLKENSKFLKHSPSHQVGNVEDKEKSKLEEILPSDTPAGHSRDEVSLIEEREYKTQLPLTKRILTVNDNQKVLLRALQQGHKLNQLRVKDDRLVKNSRFRRFVNFLLRRTMQNKSEVARKISTMLNDQSAFNPEIIPLLSNKASLIYKGLEEYQPELNYNLDEIFNSERMTLKLRKEKLPEEELRSLPQPYTPRSAILGNKLFYPNRFAASVNNDEKDAKQIGKDTQMARLSGKANYWRAFEGGKKPKDPNVLRVHDLPVDYTNEKDITSYWIGHASKIISIPITFSGTTRRLNIVIDEITGAMVSSLFYGRRAEAGVNVDKMPPIHVAMYSHNHRDHWDESAARHLAKVHDPITIVPTGDKKLAKKSGFSEEKIHTVEWWDTIVLTIFDGSEKKEVKITAVPANHWSQHSLFDAHRSGFNGFIIEADGKILYSEGDSGLLTAEQSEAIFDRWNIDVYDSSAGPDEKRFNMEGTHKSSADGIRVHFRILKSKYKRYRKEKGNHVDRLDKAEFLREFGKLQMLYMHTQAYMLGNLHYDDTETIFKRIHAVIQELGEGAEKTSSLASMKEKIADLESKITAKATDTSNYDSVVNELNGKEEEAAAEESELGEGTKLTFTGWSLEWFERDALYEILAIADSMEFANNEKITAKDIYDIMSEQIRLPKVGERTILNPKCIKSFEDEHFEDAMEQFESQPGSSTEEDISDIPDKTKQVNVYQNLFMLPAFKKSFKKALDNCVEDATTAIKILALFNTFSGKRKSEPDKRSLASLHIRRAVHKFRRQLEEKKNEVTDEELETALQKLNRKTQFLGREECSEVGALLNCSYAVLHPDRMTQVEGLSGRDAANVIRPEI